MRIFYFFLFFFFFFVETLWASTQLPSFISNSTYFISNDLSGIGLMPSDNGLIMMNNAKLLFQDSSFNVPNTYLNVNPGGMISLSNNSQIYLFSDSSGAAFLNMNGNTDSNRNINQIAIGTNSSLIVGEKNFGSGKGYLNLYDSYLYSYSLLQNNKAGVISLVSSFRNSSFYPSTISNLDNSLFQNYGVVNLFGSRQDVYNRSYLIFEENASYQSDGFGSIVLNSFSDILNLSSSDNNQDLLSNIYILNDGSENQKSRILFFNDASINLSGNFSYQLGNMNSFKNYTINSKNGSALLDFRNQNISIDEGALWAILASDDNVNFSLYNSNLNILDGGWLYVDSVLSNAGNIYLNNGGRLSFGPNAVYNIGTNISDQSYFYDYNINTISGVSSSSGNFNLADDNTIIDIASSDDSMWKNFLSQSFLNNGSIFLRANMNPLINLSIQGDGNFTVLDNAILNLTNDFSLQGNLNIGSNSQKTDFDTSLIGFVQLDNAVLSAGNLNVFNGSSLGLYNNPIINVDNSLSLNGLLFGGGEINSSSFVVSDGGWITPNVDGVLTVNGNLAFQNDGGYLAIINPKTLQNENAMESKIIVNGEVSFAQDSYISVASNGRIIEGEQNSFPVLIANSESTTNPLDINQHIDFKRSLFTYYSADWRLETSGIYAGKNVLYINVYPSYLKIYDIPNLNYNQLQVAYIIEDLYDDIDLENELDETINFIYTNIDTEALLKYVLNDLSIEKYSDFFSFLPQLNNVLKQPLVDRLSSLILNNNDYPHGIWFKPFYSSISQDDIYEFSGFSNDFYGFTLGFDTFLPKENTLLGLSFALGQSSFDSNDDFISIDSDVYAFDLYAFTKLKSFFFDYGVGFSSFSNDSIYQFISLPFGLKNEAQFTDRVVDTFLDVGYLWKFGDFFLYPKVGIKVSYLSQDAFCESGAGGLDRCIDKQDFTWTELPLSIHLGLNKDFGDFIFSPSFSFAYSRALIDDELGLYAYFENTNFEFDSFSFPIDKNLYSLSLDLNFDFKSSVDFSFKWISDFRDHYLNNQFILDLVYKF